MIISNRTFPEMLLRDSRGKRVQFDTYDVGSIRNIEKVLGENFLFWLLPVRKAPQYIKLRRLRRGISASSVLIGPV